MIDELHELRNANPHEPADLAGSVAMSRDDLIVALRTDSSRFPFATNLAAQYRQRQAAIPARVSWAGALAAIVLAVVVLGQMVVGGDDAEVDVAEIPTTLPIEMPTTTLVVEAVATDASTSTTEAATTSTAPDTTSPTTPSTTPPAPLSTTQAAPSTTAVPTTAVPTTAVPTTAVPTTAPTTTVASAPSIDGPFERGDLLAVHLDFVHTDDGLAALASREITEWFDLDPIVVAGTAQPGAFAHSYDEIMTSGWGSDWIDAATNRTAAVDLAAAEWLGVLDAGGDVWVAEGGVSDFSAEVVGSIRDARPELDTANRIHIVQHAQRNENETTPDDLASLQADADYINIDDGNNANDTADLKAASSEFESTALAGPRSTAWAVGFDYHSSGLDFSDTVAVLHILGVGIEQVADPTDFATLFM